ncbi:MAG: hypothetical protein N2423_05255 [Novosphingobium sp.]|nr:hypothetical protein [Novosphingobium sp.]
MAGAVLRITDLSADPLEAAARFHADHLLRIREALAQGDLVLVFDPADHQHRGWRLAAVQQLARESAPRRINAVVSRDEIAIAAACAYLEGAKGVTGQLLALDGNGAGSVLWKAS